MYSMSVRDAKPRVGLRRLSGFGMAFDLLVTAQYVAIQETKLGQPTNKILKRITRNSRVLVK